MKIHDLAANRIYWQMRKLRKKVITSCLPAGLYNDFFIEPISFWIQPSLARLHMLYAVGYVSAGYSEH